jgi:WD40 repeat protein
VLERIGDVMLTVRFSPDGAHVAAGGADNLIRVYTAAIGAREVLIEQHADWVTDLAYSPDGAQIASASRDRSARVFDAKTGAMRAAFLAHEETVVGVAWAAGGKSLVSAGRDRKLRTWDASDAKETAKSVGLDGEPTRLEAAGDKVYCAMANGTVRIFSTDDRKTLATLAAPGDYTDCVVVDVKSRRAIAGYHSGKVRVFDLEGGKLVKAFVASPGYAAK